MSHPSKRRLNFSSRTLFIAVTILAILLASFGNRAVRELQERRTKSEIQRLGGRFDCRHAVSLTANGWPSRFMSLMLFEDFARGVLDTKHLVYYGSVIVFGVVLTMRSVEAERWRG